SSHAPKQRVCRLPRDVGSRGVRPASPYHSAAESVTVGVDFPAAFTAPHAGPRPRGEMIRSRLTDAQTVAHAGAHAGSTLRGVGAGNHGLRLRLVEEQGKGWGPIRGRFVILDAGDNKHSGPLGALLGRETDAWEVLRVIRENI